MRDIKFRAWDEPNNEFIYWGIGDVNGDGASCTFPSGDGVHYPQMQFTGLFDKTGKGIYEKDILKQDNNRISVVGWNVRLASFVLDTIGFLYTHWFGESCDNLKCEVIGNTYENPQLLNME